MFYTLKRYVIKSLLRCFCFEMLLGCEHYKYFSNSACNVKTLIISIIEKEIKSSMDINPFRIMTTFPQNHMKNSLRKLELIYTLDIHFGREAKVLYWCQFSRYIGYSYLFLPSSSPLHTFMELEQKRNSGQRILFSLVVLFCRQPNFQIITIIS